MKIPPFIEVRSNTYSKKRYYLFEPELYLTFDDGSRLKVCNCNNKLNILVCDGNNYLEIAGAKRKEIIITQPVFFSFMNNDIFVDNLKNAGGEELFSWTGLNYISRVMNNTCEEIMRHARNEDIVFIFGETGTGKELMAKNIHYNSRRRQYPFVVVNAGSLEPDRADCELFGSVKGAYTNSEDNLRGAFVNAGKGSLIIDEIGNIPLESQAKLLRAIEYREIRAVGSDTPRKHNARVIVLSNRSPEDLLKEKKIREDLFYRIERHQVGIPALRLRKEDIIPLALFFTGGDYTFTEAAMSLLQSHNWPGNVRELRNCLDRAMLFSKNRIIDCSDILINRLYINRRNNMDRSCAISDYIRVECELIKAILGRNDKNVSKTSRDLGISRGTLITRIKKYRILH